MRCQALESGEFSSSLALEMAFIERQGLAAWITTDWNNNSFATENKFEQTITVNPSHDLVLVLAELVVGDREEVARV